MNHSVTKIMALVEAYRTSGGREEYWARQDILRYAVEELVKDAQRWEYVKHNMHTVPYDDTCLGPEYHLSNETIDALIESNK